MNYEHIFDQAIERLHSEGRYRVFADIRRRRGAFPSAERFVTDGTRDIKVWCSNDYLGMGQHPVVLAAMHEALDTVGAGSGGTRNISGTTHYHVELEAEIADLHGKDAALLFTSAFVANDATLSTLQKLLPGCVILSDEKNHASMIAGIRNGGGPKLIFKNNDLADLEAIPRHEITLQDYAVDAIETPKHVPIDDQHPPLGEVVREGRCEGIASEARRLG